MYNYGSGGSSSNGVKTSGGGPSKSDNNGGGHGKSGESGSFGVHGNINKSQYRLGGGGNGGLLSRRRSRQGQILWRQRLYEGGHGAAWRIQVRSSIYPF